VVEQRRFTRTPLDVEAVYTLKGAGEARSGIAKDISVGGMFIETSAPPAFGAEVVVRVRLPKVKDEMVLPGIVRWTSARGMGVQFGLLGARETHTITEIVGKG
jgi:type IV pilus assembly protein PilZ